MDGSHQDESNVSNNSVPYDYCASEKNHYYARPPSFNANSTQFECWNITMYTYIIGLSDEL